MKKICILTATRAEYGLLSSLIKQLKKYSDIQVEIVATGMHLSPEFGLTYKEIEADGEIIAEKIPILLSADTPNAISKTMGLAMISFADYFERSKPDMLVVLGDRYETAAICCVAVNARIPIAHLHGGETTEGAVDEAYRHSITKMSYLHFTSTEAYRKRVIQMGENPERVFNVGAIGVENVLKTPVFSKKELEENLQIELDSPYAVVTFHPVTLEEFSAENQITQLLDAIKAFPDMKFFFTKANSDADGRIINKKIAEFSNENPNCILFDSLGMKRYLSLVSYCDVVIGNSSSGLIEVPSFKIPTINIGDRQKGRIAGSSVLNTEVKKENIIASIKKALSKEFKKECSCSSNPYYMENTSGKISEIIREFLVNDGIDLKKTFYDFE